MRRKVGLIGVIMMSLFALSIWGCSGGLHPEQADQKTVLQQQQRNEHRRLEPELTSRERKQQKQIARECQRQENQSNREGPPG